MESFAGKELAEEENMITEISKRPHVQVGDIICNSHGLTAHKNVFDSYYLHAYSICRVVKISENGKFLTVKDIEDKENVNFALPNKKGKKHGREKERRK